jgi:hypothetical protein
LDEENPNISIHKDARNLAPTPMMLDVIIFF